jgi:hypothetical protein
VASNDFALCEAKYHNFCQAQGNSFQKKLALLFGNVCNISEAGVSLSIFIIKKIIMDMESSHNLYFCSEHSIYEIVTQHLQNLVKIISISYIKCNSQVTSRKKQQTWERQHKEPLHLQPYHQLSVLRTPPKFLRLQKLRPVKTKGVPREQLQ